MSTVLMFLHSQSWVRVKAIGSRDVSLPTGEVFVNTDHHKEVSVRSPPYRRNHRLHLNNDKSKLLDGPMPSSAYEYDLHLPPFSTHHSSQHVSDLGKNKACLNNAIPATSQGMWR